MIGARLGTWIIDKELGRGGMGCVYLAHQETPEGRQAAVKVLAAELAKDARFQHRFQREIDALSLLDHPNIVRFHEAGAQDGFFFYVMEYVEGRDLEEVLHEQGRLPWQEVLDVALQVCPAMKHAHDHGIIHRDLKPSNLLRTADGQIKLTDFGVAKVFSSTQLTATGGLVGTAQFLSPEQAAGKPVTPRSDLYSLGVVLYTLLTGRTPFEGQSVVDLLHKHRFAQFDPPKTWVPEIPSDFDALICQLLEKDPAKRPANGLALHRLLDRIRRKLDRQGNPTVALARADGTVSDDPVDESDEESGPGPATLMGRLVRRELELQKYGGPLARFLNQPWVLGSLFVLCVGLMVWGFWRPRPSAEELFHSAEALMASIDPADWDRARDEYLERLNQIYPDHPYRDQVTEYRQRITDFAAQRKALENAKAVRHMSEAQRIYQKGLRLCQEGDITGARQDWQNVVRLFRDAESEQRWVRLAERGLAELDELTPK